MVGMMGLFRRKEDFRTSERAWDALRDDTMAVVRRSATGAFETTTALTGTMAKMAQQHGLYGVVLIGRGKDYLSCLRCGLSSLSKRTGGGRVSVEIKAPPKPGEEGYTDRLVLYMLCSVCKPMEKTERVMKQMLAALLYAHDVDEEALGKGERPADVLLANAEVARFDPQMDVVYRQASEGSEPMPEPDGQHRSEGARP